MNETAMQKPRSIGRALFILTLAVYVLTMSGHTYSPDDESMFYVTQNILSRGAFDIPNPKDYPVVGGQRGLGGKIYPGQGVAQSLAAIPFYLAGSLLARAAEPRFTPYLLRLAVGLFDPVVSALIALLIYAYARRLGFHEKTAVSVALVWAFATMAWVYAKTFYNEPLTTLLFLVAFYAALRSRQEQDWRSLTLAGLAASASVFVKVQAVLLLPALAVYVGWSLFTREISIKDWKPRLREALAFGAPAALLLGLWLAFNWYRFGNPLATGYGGGPASIPITEGLRGLLFSPGKSLFLYAPPVVLSLLALRDFWSVHRAEAVAFAFLIVTIVLFHARVEYWHGDGAWGPRYLYYTLPFFLIIAASWFERARQRRMARGVTLALVGAGLAVTLLGVVINFDTYLQIQPNPNARYYDPARSPIVAHWNLLWKRAGDWYEELLAPHEGVALLDGFLNSTGTQDEMLPRFMAQRAMLSIYAEGVEALRVDFRFADYRPASAPRREVLFWMNGARIGATHIPVDDPGYLYYHFDIAPPRTARALIEIETLGSQARGSSPQGDELGLQVQAIQARAGDRPLDFLPDLALPPIPLAQPKAQWDWFFNPSFEHFDFWLWYLYFSGLPRAVVWTIALPLLTVGIVALVGAAFWLLRELNIRRVTLPAPIHDGWVVEARP